MNRTHFNTPDGVVDVPTPLQLGSDQWKVAQFIQKQYESEANGVSLSSAQTKRFKTAIAKAAKSYNDNQLICDKLADETAKADILRKQIRKDEKKKRMKTAKQHKYTQQHMLLTKEADALFEQCEKLHITPSLSSDETDETVIQKCQDALTLYITRPLTNDELVARDQVAEQQRKQISADARSKEVFLDAKTNLVTINQMADGDELQFPKKKKKTNRKKQDAKKPLPDTSDTSDVKIDWGPDVKMGEQLTKAQRRQIATTNKVAGGA